jgi:DNA-binding response OmpR family regulator
MAQAEVIIFYADDDPDDREFLTDAFKNHSVDVELITCENGAEAVHYFKNLSPFEPLPCLIILDLNMPMVGGKETLQWLRRMDRVKDIPVVFFTTSSQERDKIFARQNNAGFITKPIDIGQLENIVDQLIDHCTDDTKALLRPQLN